MTLAPRPATQRHGPEAGVALPIALMGMLLIAALGAGIWMSVAVGARSVENRKISSAAVQLAEGGAAHAIHVLRDHLDETSFSELLIGDDGIADTEDDGRLIGFGLDSSLMVPEEGIDLPTGTYEVLLLDDPAEIDGDETVDTNLRILVRAVGRTPDGGAATIDVVVNDGPSSFVPSFVADGDLYVGGNPTLVGSCGGVHGNESVFVSGNLTVTQTVAAVDTVTVSGSIERPDGTSVSPTVHATAIEVPDYPNPIAEFCTPDEADYMLQADGYALRVSDSTLHDGRVNKVFGWKRNSESPVGWTFTGSGGDPGTYCVAGNASISGNPDGGGGPLSMTIIASKSIDISGNPQIRADHSEDILLMAGSDVRINGNLAGDPGDYSGLIYARAQCDLRGNAHISSRVLCNDQNNASGAFNLVDQNGLGGNVELDYDCAATTGLTGPREAVSWSQRLGG